jgi:hypothetical protein
MNSIQLIQVTPEELVTMITESVKNHFQELSKKMEVKTTSIEKEFLTRKETAQLFQISLVTIHEWQNNGVLKPYKMGNRTYFKYSELLDVLYKSNRS